MQTRLIHGRTARPKVMFYISATNIFLMPDTNCCLSKRLFEEMESDQSSLVIASIRNAKSKQRQTGNFDNSLVQWEEVTAIREPNSFCKY